MANLLIDALNQAPALPGYVYRPNVPLHDSLPRVGPDYRERPVRPREGYPAPPEKGAYGIAGGNVVGAIRTSRLHGDRFDVYDSLPRAVREALQQAVVDQCPMTIRSRYQPIADLVPDRDEAARLYVGAFHKAEAQEIERHSETYRIRYRTPAPHVGARASVLRADYRKRRRT